MHPLAGWERERSCRPECANSRCRAGAYRVGLLRPSAREPVPPMPPTTLGGLPARCARGHSVNTTPAPRVTEHGSDPRVAPRYVLTTDDVIKLDFQLPSARSESSVTSCRMCLLGFYVTGVR